jgi:glucosamine kinase
VTLFMGIDGGGSTLRVVVCDANLNVRASVKRGTANPNAIGLDASAHRLRDAVTAALAAVDAPVVAVGAGIAGTYTTQRLGWVADILREVLPDATIAAVPDLEIALVGALGRPHGALLLAGTGSAAYGVRSDGERALVGGWGYLLGDEGGGFWLGREALRVATVTPTDAFAVALRAHLNLTTPREMAAWLYSAENPVAQAATLAPFVLESAENRDPTAVELVRAGVGHLVNAAQSVTAQLGLDVADVAFAGSLLTHDNALSRGVCAALGRASRPVALYPPEVGAALMGRLRHMA